MKNFINKLSILIFFLLISISFTSGAFALDSEIKLIKDINNIEKGSNPNEFKEVNGYLLFKANDNFHGEELWRTDGTTAGTVLVKDIYPGATGSSVSYPSTTETVVLNNQLFFLANDGTHGTELWKSNGTSAGTVLVKDIREGSNNTTITDIEVSNGLVFFEAYTTSGSELWKSDGTEVGTVIVKDIRAGSGSSSPTNLTDVNGTLFFQASSISSSDYELWKSDGTSDGTVMVKNDAGFGGNVSYFQDCYNYDGLLIFVVVKGSSKYLWISDGTTLGTVQIKTLSNDPDDFIQLNGILYFNIGDSTYGTELWKTDGTAIGTTVVKDIVTGSGSFSPRNLTLLNDKIYFNNLTQLWESDGTESGTVLVKSIDDIGDVNHWYDQIITFGDNIYFTAYDSSNGYELWKSNGTTGSTAMLKDIYTGTGNSAEPYFYSVFNGNLFFSAYTPTNGREIYKSDGTANGTVLLKNINTTTESADPSTLIKLDEVALFAATSSQGRELWKTDKTSVGTTIVKDIYSGSGSSNPTDLTKLGNKVIFIANNGVNGNELWISDGTSSGTYMLKDIYSGSSNSSITGLVAADNLVYFFADNGTVGKELWKSDGTSAGTVLVKDITVGSGSSNPLNSTLYPIDNKVYFNIHQVGYGYELWVSNGTSAGTYMIKDIYPGTESSNVYGIIKINDVVIFSANDGVHGQEVWRTDDTEIGTLLLLDITPLGDWFSPLGHSNPGNFFLFNDILLFRAEGELWKTDGTSAGTSHIKTLYAGFEGVSNPRNFKLFGGKVYFIATPVGTNQDELYITDGTTAGTKMVKDIYPGSTGSGASNLIVVNGRLYFTANHPTYGKELWMTDGTEAGTYMAYDVYEGAISSDPRIIKFNDDIIVTGTLTEYGRELFWIQMPPNPPWGLGAIALSTTSIQLNWTDISKSEDRFNIYYSTDGVNYTKYGSVAKDVTTITLTGLLPNTLYWFKASGENDKGQNYTDPITRATRSSYSDFVLTSSPIENSDLCQIKATWLGNSTSYNLSYGDTVLSEIVENEYTIPDLDCNKKYDISLTGRNVEGVYEAPITLRIKTSKSSIVIVDEEITPPILDNNDNENNSNEDVEGTRLIDSVVEIAKSVTTPEFADSAQEVALATGAAATLLQPAVGGVSMFTNSLSLSNIFVLLGQFFNKILIFFGFKKQGRDFGYVYNSVTKSPISLAVIRFYNLAGELVTTAVTNSFGVFETDIEKGKYKLVISKNGFEFPSKLIIGGSDGEIQNIYNGGYVDLEKQDISNISVPLDPIEANNLFFAKRILLQIIKYLSFGLFVIGFLYSCYVLYNYVNLYNFLVLVVYAFIIHQYVFAWMYANRHGVVKKDGKVVKGVKVGLMLASLDKIVDVRITDSEGKYKFIATPGEYQIVLNDNRYTEVSTNDKVFAITGKSPEVIYRNIEIN